MPMEVEFAEAHRVVESRGREIEAVGLPFGRERLAVMVSRLTPRTSKRSTKSTPKRNSRSISTGAWV